jgi:hypothetical protein
MSNTYRKFITHGNTGLGIVLNAFVIANHYNHQLNVYQKMAEEAAKDFPTLDIPSIAECRTVFKSSWCKGMPVLHFSIPNDCPLPDAEQGWKDLSPCLPDVVLS